MEVPLKEEVYSLEFKSLEIIMGLSGDKDSILKEMESGDYPLSFWLSVLTNYIRNYSCYSGFPPIEIVGNKILEKTKSNKDLVHVYAKVLFASLYFSKNIDEVEAFKNKCVVRIRKEMSTEEFINLFDEEKERQLGG